MRNPDMAPPNAGFTLIEVIVSFVILATILGSVTLSLSYSTKLNHQAEAKRGAVLCAERFFAERFDRRPGKPGTESGAEGEDCRWRVGRTIKNAAYTDSGRPLMALHLEIMDRQGAPIDVFDTYYVEDLP